MSLLAIDNLSLHFGGVRAVENVSFRVEPQEVFTLIGPNGAGKTSTMRSVMGLIPPRRVRFT